MQEYQIWYIHQTDKKMFNRGALLNIGFLLAKDKYPEYYLEITYVFHDIDIMPTGCNIINYNTEKNIIYHPQTRRVKSLSLKLKTSKNKQFEFEITPEINIFMCGLGYMHPDWGHGQYKGELVTQYDT